MVVNFLLEIIIINAPICIQLAGAL